MSRSKPSYAYPDSFSWGVFITVYGDFPHPCYFCEGKVEARTQPRNREAATVHHVDHDRWNNVPGNLVAAHHGCHVGYHGRTSSQETRTKRAAANRGKQHSPEWCAKTSATWDSAKRANASDRARTAIAEGRIPPPPSHTGKKRSPETRKKMSEAHLGQVVSTKARARMSEAAKQGWAKRKEKQMAISGQDSYGSFIDTGIGTAVTPRASVEVEVHQAAEVETGSKFLPPVIPASHIPHRSPNSPR